MPAKWFCNPHKLHLSKNTCERSSSSATSAGWPGLPRSYFQNEHQNTGIEIVRKTRSNIILPGAGAMPPKCLVEWHFWEWSHNQQQEKRLKLGQQHWKMKSCNTGEERKQPSRQEARTQLSTSRLPAEKTPRHLDTMRGTPCMTSAELGRWICSVCRKVQMALNQLNPRSALLVNSAAKPERNAYNWEQSGSHSKVLRLLPT